MKVLMNMCPRFLMSHAGDYYANVEIAEMRHRYPDMSFTMLDSLPAIVAANARVALLRAAGSAPGLNPRWRALRPLYYLRYVTWLPQSYLRRTRPDVIFAHGQIPWLPRECRVPLLGIEYFATDRHLKKAGIYDLKSQEIEVKRWNASRVTQLVTTTPGSRSRLETHLPEWAGRIAQIPIFMPYLEAIGEDAAIRKHRDRSGPVRILFVGGEARRKGLPQLVEALGMLDSATRKEVELTVVSRFRDGAVEGLQSCARVLSGVGTPALLQLMRDAHIFAFPTSNETFGRVIVEAMAAGCAVISSNVDPQDWLLDFGRAGVPVDPDSPSEIASALTQLVRDRERSEALGLAALERFRTVFHPSVVAAQYREIFQRLCESST